MRLRIAFLPVLALAAVLSTLTVAGPAASVAQAKPAIGFADQSVATFLDPRFQALKIKRVRAVVPYDLIKKGGKNLAVQDAYFAEAHKQGKDIRVAWYRTSSCSAKCAARRLPSVSEFRNDFRAFRKRYPYIKKFSTWNEANYPLAQPTGRNPKRAAQFYNVMRKDCSGGRCQVLAGDVRANSSKKYGSTWIKTFRKYAIKGGLSWGLIAYPDTAKSSNKYTKLFLKDTGRGNVYVTEVGALNTFGRFLPKASLTRQDRAMKYMMTRYWKTSSRIKEMYVYNWRSGNKAFDAALLNPNGTPRPAYNTFVKYLKGFRH
jgi:hypothetical protein